MNYMMAPPPPVNSPQYHAYYQQYMQYMQYYSNPAMMHAYMATNPTYYNFPPTAAPVSSSSSSITSAPKPTPPKQAAASAIKINLKCHQETTSEEENSSNSGKPVVKKSRFDSLTSNVAKEQTDFQAKQQQPEIKVAVVSTPLVKPEEPKKMEAGK